MKNVASCWSLVLGLSVIVGPAAVVAAQEMKPAETAYTAAVKDPGLEAQAAGLEAEMAAMLRQETSDLADMRYAMAECFVAKTEVPDARIAAWADERLRTELNPQGFHDLRNRCWPIKPDAANVLTFKFDDYVRSEKEFRRAAAMWLDLRKSAP